MHCNWNCLTRGGLAGCCFSFLVLSAESFAQPKLPPSSVEVAKVQQRDVAAGQTFVGTVHPLKISSVGSAVDGRVT